VLDLFDDMVDSAAGSTTWRVVGGKTTGGIVVRKGRALQSMPCDERLETGALVEEYKLDGDRLNYWKLSGFGPQMGWVSISLKGKELLVRDDTAILNLDKDDGAHSGNDFGQALFGNDRADKTAIDPAPHAADPAPRAGAVAAVHTAVAAYNVAHVPRSQLQCATPSCRFRVHTKKELGGYCCIACSEGGDHGPRCEQAKAPLGAHRADANWLPMEGGQLAEVELDEAIRLSMLEVTTQCSGNEVEDSELQEAIQLSMMDIAGADADLAEAIRLSMVDAAASEAEAIHISMLATAGTPAAETTAGRAVARTGNTVTAHAASESRSLRTRYRANAKYRDQVQYVARQLQMCIASELKLSAIFKGPVSEVLQGFYEADLMKTIEDERLSCVETLNVLRTFVVEAEAEESPHKDTARTPAPDGEEQIPLETALKPVQPTTDGKFREVQRQLEGLRKAEEEHLEPSSRDKELPSNIAALLCRLGESNRSLVREIKYAAGNTLKFQYMQKCLLLAEGTDSQFQGKEELRELWLALDCHDREDIERAFHLADGQRDAFFLSVIDEDRRHRQKL